MTRITKTDAYGLMEAYNSIYTPSEEQIEIEELGISIVENAANVLFSQGYDVNDLCDYFEKASTEVISEDYLNFAEGKTYISESFIVSDKYVQEQFNILEDLLGASEMLSEAGFMASQKAKLAAQRAANPNPVPKSTPIPSPAKPKVTSPTNSRVTSNYSVPASQMGPKLPPKPGILQRAGNFAKGLMSKAKDVVKKIPGAGTVAKIAKSPVGKFAGKVGSRVLPGVGVVAYGADAAKRFKKGDWGGGLLSTAGAVTSAIPGAGLVAGLAPAAIQAGTDALGLTGDRSKKGPKTVGPKLVGPKIVGPKIVGPKPSSPSGGGGSGGGGRSSTPSSASPKPNPTKPTASAKPAIGKLGNTSFERRTPTSSELKAAQSARASGASPEKALQAAQKTNLPTQGSPDAKVDPKAVNDAIKAQQERDKNRAKPQAVNASYEYDAYDLVLEYLLSQGHVDTVEEANYVMLVMDAETIGSIVEEYENDLLAEEITEWVNELVEGGYDLSEYTWDDLAEYYVNEAKVDKYLDNKLKKSVGDDEIGRSMRRDIKISQRQKRRSVTYDTPRQRKLAQKLRDNRDADNDEGPLGYAARSQEK
jgi:hypothetical protein